MSGNTWSKDAHPDRMRDSRHFRFTRELFLHHIEQGDAARFIEMILTNAYSYQFKLKTITRVSRHHHKAVTRCLSDFSITIMEKQEEHMMKS